MPGCRVPCCLSWRRAVFRFRRRQPGTRHQGIEGEQETCSVSAQGRQGMAAGRFSKAADPLFREINDSLGFDYRLLKQDIAGSIAWAAALQRAGVLTADEHKRLASAL